MTRIAPQDPPTEALPIRAVRAVRTARSTSQIVPTHLHTFATDRIRTRFTVK
jgi:hypothetical protein